MSLKLILIIDKSQAYISFQKNRVLDSWQTPASDLKVISSMSEAGRGTLFGGGVVSLLTLDDAEAVKQTVETLEKAKANGELSSLIGDGVVITSQVARTSTKKLEKLVKELGGDLIISAVDRKEKVSTSEKLLSELNLNPAAREYLLAYVGDDYEALVPLIKTMSALSPKQQLTVTEQDLAIRMPQPKGAVPPWNLERPLFAGDLTTSIDIFRRVSEHSSPLVVLAVLKNKIAAAYKVSAILESNPRASDAELSKAAGVKAQQLYFVKQNHKKYGRMKLQRAAALVADTEAKVKGGSGADPMVNMEIMLVRIANLFAG